MAAGFSIDVRNYKIISSDWRSRVTRLPSYQCRKPTATYNL